MDNDNPECKSAGKLTALCFSHDIKLTVWYSGLLPYDKHGYAKRSKNPREYRVRDEFGKIVAYGHTPEEAVRKAKKKQNPFGLDLSDML